MIKIQKILYPTDLDEYSDHALVYARELAATYGATLHLVHVVDANWSGPIAAASFPGQLENYYKDFQETGTKALQQMATEIKEAPVTTALLNGTPHAEIVRYARNQNIDLIVLATHGRTGLSHILIGSVAEKVVQMAPCPVLTVKHPEHEFVLP